MTLLAACVKWVELDPEVDPLHGTIVPRRHGSGLSDADLAAVETALRLRDRWGGEVVVACVGPAAADPALRELLSCGVDRAVRVQVDGGYGGSGPSSAEVARLLAALWPGPHERPDVVVCGDASVDRGSGSVPAYLAHELGAAQALGLVAVDVVSDEVSDEVSDDGDAASGGDAPTASTASTALTALRRLDGGRRERLRVIAPAVLSVEGSIATLRRATLAATLATRSAPVEVHPGPAPDPRDDPRLLPWRPRPHALPGPAAPKALDRIVALTGALTDRTPPRTLELDPPAAADAIVQQLREWGYLPADE